MRAIIGLSAALAAVVLAASSGAADPAACSLLTQPQVASATGLKVGPGAPIAANTPTSCVWTDGAGSNVTLTFITLQAFNFGRTMPGASVTAVSGVGDDAYYLALGDQVGLGVKKGGLVFKVAVYKHVAVSEKEAAEKTLALQVASKL
jgi:hypothetical protein